MATTNPDFMAAWRARIEMSRQRRDDHLSEWQTNIAYLLGRPFARASSVDRVAVPADWPRVKRKKAQLWSQLPQVTVTSKVEATQPLAPIYTSRLNEVLLRAHTKSALDEVVVDMVNAAGIGAVLVTLNLTSDPTTQITVDREYVVQRIAPDDLLWPADTTTSNSDLWPWVGRTGRGTATEIQRLFKLTSAQIERAKGSARKESLTADDPEQWRTDDLIEFDEVFYKRAIYHTDEQHFCALQRLVFVQGLDQPVVNERYRAQTVTPLGYGGVTIFPIRTCVLTTISDTPVPPSDSQAARPQVQELQEGRSHMIQQRRHSLPIRLVNPTIIPPETIEAINAGEQQALHIIKPGQLPEQAITVVAQGPQRQEEWGFQGILDRELDELWALSRNQLGAEAHRGSSATETAVIQQNANVIQGEERERIKTLFLSICEVLLGLISVYDHLPLTALDPQQQALIEVIPKERIPTHLTCTIRPGSTVVEDGEVRLQKLLRLYNMAGADKRINSEPILREIVELTGLDPAKVLQALQPPPPEPLNISLRRAEDLRDPLMLALLLKTGQAPGMLELKAAKKMLADAAQPFVAEPVMPAPVDPFVGLPPVPVPIDDDVSDPTRFRTGLATPPRMDRRAVS